MTCAECSYCPYLLILTGAALMLCCIIKFRNAITIAKGMLLKKNHGISLLHGMHLSLMVIFFAGYCVVFYFLIRGIQSAGILFVAIGFFFGALFALLSIVLQLDTLSSIKVQHESIKLANQQLLQTESVTIFTLAHQAELRGLETGKHIERTAHYVRLLAQGLSEMPKYRSYLVSGYIADIEKSAPLHDIGMVAVPDSILKKPGKLTPEEFEIVKTHCENGARLLRTADGKLSFQSFLKIAVQMVASHHEKWNGKGYPRGLADESIPLSGRIMALADVYDALRSDYPYKKRLSHEEACKIIAKEKGEHFDPDIVEVFSSIESKFHEISVGLAG